MKWWQRGVVYEIVPISFQDSNGDGRGDLPGLIEHIDYLRWLGVDVVWLTPVFHSPFLDLGYDISDHCGIDPQYGTLADFDGLLSELHRHGMRLLLDFVPNHTSDQHAWFGESRSSRQSAKRDWYIWAEPASNGGPPNNWLSRFGGSAWEWDAGTEQFYYHSFLREQPDLNWRNPEVRAAMAEVMRFWLRRGVDGFRVDASAVLAKDALLRDDPPAPDVGSDTPPPQRLKHIFTDDRPETLNYIADMRAVLDEFDGRALAGEVQGKTERIGHFYGNDKLRLHLPLNFALLDSPWNALSLQANIDAYYNAIPDQGWPNWVIGGHDKHRVATKLGQAQSRNLAMLLLTLKGTPFLFAGDEIGAEQVEIPPDRIYDPFEKLVGGYGLCRDPERSPMRWDGSRNGGFTTGEPWLPMGSDIKTRNVKVLMSDKRSLLSLYRALIALRRREPVLIDGEYQPVRSHNDILTYRRTSRDAEMLVALNLVHEPRRMECAAQGTILLSTCLDGEKKADVGPLLRPDEGVIIKLK